MTPEEQLEANKNIPAGQPGSPWSALSTPIATPTPAPIVTRYTSPAPTVAAPTLALVDENSIREDTRKRMQSSVDAINANYANLISQEQVQGQDRSGQTRAINARSGLSGSDFGQAQQEKTTQFNKGQVKALEDEKAAKVNSILLNIEDRASAEIQNRKNEALGTYQRDMAAYEKAQESARADLKTLAGSGFNLDQLNPAQKQALLKQAGYEGDMGEIIYNALKPSASKIDFKFEKLADGQGLFYGVDPTTGELVTKNFAVDIPDNWKMTIGPDGTPIQYNDTGEARIAPGFGQGQFAKPEVAGSELLKNPKDQAAFNQIVNKYSASPLIKAADRTVVLKGTVDSLRKDPSNSSKQLSLVYGFIQALDTYQSAVREGELGLVNSIDSKVGKIQNYISQIQQGQIVRPEVALQIAQAAEDLGKYIAEGAKAKEDLFASQARVNGIEDAWDSFRGGFTSSYDEPKVELTPFSRANEPGAHPLLKKYPYKEVRDYLIQNPNATEQDIQQGLEELGFNKVGKTSASSDLKTRNLSFAPSVSNVSVSIGKGAGVKNNNPGNLRNIDGSWMKFSTPQEGFKALMGYVERAKQGDHARYNSKQSLYQFFSIYAPSADKNNPKGYAETVARNLGISPNTPIGKIDTFAFAKEIARHESSTKVNLA